MIIITIRQLVEEDGVAGIEVMYGAPYGAIVKLIIITILDQVEEDGVAGVNSAPGDLSPLPPPIRRS